MEEKLVARLTAFLYEHKVTLKPEVLGSIAEEVVERWEIETPRQLNKLTFEYFSPEPEDEIDCDEDGSLWVYYGKRDMSFDLDSGECTGSGGWL